MRSSAHDMTRGQPIPMLVRFALPLMLGSLFQQLYSFVDTAIVGRGISVDALSAVGVTGSLSFVILGFAMGACGGFCIPIAQNVGAGDREETSRFFWNGLYGACGIGLVLTLAATPFLRQLLTMMNTPAQLLDMAVEYLTVIVLGTVPSLLYNYFAGVLRAFGDSKHPFYFLLISSGLNVILDLVFILNLRMGVMGAALATVLSQGVSAVLCAWWLFRKLATIRTEKPYRRFSLGHVGQMLRIGVPLGFETCVTSLGFLVLQRAINTLGAVAAAAQVCGEKIRHIATIPCDSLGIAMSTYVGQNYGAKRMDRIRAGLRGGLIIQAVVCSVTWVILLVGKEPLVFLLLGDTGTAEAAGAIRYIEIVSALFLLQGTMKVMRGIVQGMGFAFAAFLSGVMEILGRILGGRLAVLYGSFTMICLSNPLAWGFAMVQCAFAAWYYLRKETKRFQSSTS